MAGTLGGMLKSGREYLKDPKNNFAALDKDCASVKDQNAELLKDLIPIPERMVDLCGDLAEDSAKLLKALEDNDERRANIHHRDVNRHLQVKRKVGFGFVFFFFKKKNLLFARSLLKRLKRLLLMATSGRIWIG